MKSPMISVVMPVYNGEKYLREAIDSILNQTYSDFEFIILNDGSTDRTEEIILAYDDPRIVYVKNEKNLQIVKTLNKGIELAKGKYIARMDADDISLPERFEKQIAFMEKNLNIGVCGAWLLLFGDTIGDTNSTWKPPLKHDEIIFTMLFSSALMHPLVMIRKDVFDELDIVYRDEYNKVEDYDLWQRLVNTTEFANLQEILLHYRINDFGVKRQEYKSSQRLLAEKVRKNMLELFGVMFNHDELSLHMKISHGDTNQNTKYLLNTKLWFRKIIQSNKESGFVDPIVCEGILIDKYYKTCMNSLVNTNILLVFYHFCSFVGFSSNRKKLSILKKSIISFLYAK